jgi:hypothetical protein
MIDAALAPVSIGVRARASLRMPGEKTLQTSGTRCGPVGRAC